jgi:PqqD family protein of HPr-rel-A system
VPASAQALPSTPAESWAAIDPTGLCWALWSCDNVLFHAETGETHILSELPTLVLRKVQSARALTTAELGRETADACGTVADHLWQEKVGAILHSLESLELIERQPSTGA